ncbi:MAG TPA: regulatory protein NosR, partial [Gammaproteobacteria bacterium]|nr:regulatory protein NosR [Gammaproteobacteria bacterium]
DKAFENTQGMRHRRGRSEEEAQETFIDLYYGYLNVPSIGRNLLGDSEYRWLMDELGPDDHAIAVLANGE